MLLFKRTSQLMSNISYSQCFNKALSTVGKDPWENNCPSLRCEADRVGYIGQHMAMLLDWKLKSTRLHGPKPIQGF